MLYIMRHGSTIWNEMNKLQGHTDIPLSVKGRKMAESARDEYQNVHFDICYCSPLKRAKETAEIVVGDRGIPVISDDRLKEMSFGVCEGITGYRTDQEGPVAKLFFDPENYTEPPEGAESISDLFERTGEFLREVIDPGLEQGKDILIVGHGVMNTSIICRRMNIPVSRFWSKGLEQCRLIQL